MSFTTKYFQDVITGGDANHNFATGTFTASISADANNLLSGTWSFSGSYIADSSTGPDPYVKNGSGNISFSGTIAGNLLSGFSNSWQVFFTSPDARFDQGSYGSLDRVGSVFDLDASIEFDLPFLNRVDLPITEHFGAFKNDLLATALPPIISIDHYTASLTEYGQFVFVTLERSGADLGGTSTVLLSTEDGAAVSSGLNSDFEAANILVEFAPGISSRFIWLTTVNDDAIAEANENFHIRISDPVNATLGFATGDVIIIDNDKTGTVGADVLAGGTTDDAFYPGGGNDSLDGGPGIDISHYNGNRANYTIVHTSNGYTVKDNVGNDGTDTLVNVERLHFADTNHALDLDGNAGDVARILGAVFGAAAVNNPTYVALGLDLLDDPDLSLADVMGIALDVRLGAGYSEEAEINLLFQNLTGAPANASQLAYWKSELSAGHFSHVSLALMAAELPLNANNIGLVGLMQTGLAYADLSL